MKQPSLYALKKKQYIEQLRALPVFQEKRTQAYINLTFTLIALIVFGLFAINPTIGTILNLHKQIEDSTIVRDELDRKIANLSSLQQQYRSIEPDLPLVFSALPQSAKAPYLMGQIQALAEESGISLTGLNVGKIQLSQQENLTGQEINYEFEVSATGSYEQLNTFTSFLSKFDRIITFTSLTITRDTDETTQRSISIVGNAYFKE